MERGDRALVHREAAISARGPVHVHDPEKLATQLAARMAAMLLICGGLGILGTVLIIGSTANISVHGVLAVGLAAMSTGAVVWLLPWKRWHPRTSLMLVPIAFLLIGLGNHFAAAEPFRYSVAFIVAFCWIGFAHPRGTSLGLAPLLAFAYVAPLYTTASATPQAVGALFFVAPVSIAVGESMAWVVARLRAAEAGLQRMAGEARFRSLVQNASDVIMIVDEDHQIVYETPSVKKVLGIAPDKRLNTSALDRIHADDRPRLLDAFARALPGGMEQRIDFRARHANGRWHQLLGSVTNLLDDPHVRGYVVNYRDISDRKELEQRLQYQAFHDPLTGLANRALFTDRLEHALARVARGGHRPIVLFIDLDDFKTINDTLGHEAGDEVLETVAARIRSCIRPGDTAARFGGDEFAVLVEEADAAFASALAQRTLDVLSSPIPVRGKEITIRASIGVVAGTGARVTASQMLRNADVAMYSAKDAGKGRLVVFRPAMQRQLARRLRLKSDLERAVEQNAFALRYQPVVELESNRMIGVEALLRWRHPRRGLLSPAAFMSVAEESGLIVPIGRWVLREACRQGQTWLERSGHEQALFMSVNMSVRQLEEPSIVDDVVATLKGSRFPAELLTIEITESVLMRDVQSTMGVLGDLRGLGVRLVIDDFGTGYSSLSYLRRFPITGIKIDRSFLSRLEHDDDAAVAASIIALSEQLGLDCVVEGIEFEPQLHRIVALGGRLGQGYLLAEPVSSEAIEELITVGRSVPRANGGRGAAGGQMAGLHARNATTTA